MMMMKLEIPKCFICNLNSISPTELKKSLIGVTIYGYVGHFDCWFLIFSQKKDIVPWMLHLQFVLNPPGGLREVI